MVTKPGTTRPAHSPQSTRPGGRRGSARATGRRTETRNYGRRAQGAARGDDPPLPEGSGKGGVWAALTALVPAPGCAHDQQEQKEAGRSAAPGRCQPAGRRHGAERRWRAAAGHSRARAGAAGVHAPLRTDAGGSGRGQTKVCRRAAAADGPCATLTSLPLRRVWGPEWSPLWAGRGRGAVIGAEPRAAAQAVSWAEGRPPEGSSRRCCG